MRQMKLRWSAVVFVSALALLTCTCGRKDAGEGAEPSGRPGELVISFWHTQADENGRLLEQIIDQFNRTHRPIRVQAIYVAGYDQIFRKLKASLLAGELPDLAVAYESMVAEYAHAGAVVPLDQYLEDPEIGLSDEDLEDIYPVFIQTNRFSQFGNQLLSFPFTKSVLLMYSNLALIREAGFEGPPASWDEFLDQCRAIREKTGRTAYALSVDPSTIHAMILSFGGELVDPETLRTGYASPAGIQTFEVIDRLIRDKLAHVIQYNSYDDRADLAAGRAAFMIRSSTSRPYLDEMIGEKFPWAASIIPHGDGQQPVTVLFGANICMFRSTPEKQRAAWQFIKYFASREVTALWATRTGYMPVRRSALEVPEMAAFLTAKPQNRSAIDTLPFARPEPNLAGIQEVRTLVEKAENDIIYSIRKPHEAARELAQAAERVLRQSHRPTPVARP